MKKLVFLEFIDEAEAYLARQPEVPADTLFIALTPRVRFYLAEKGLKVHSTYEYFTTDSHQRISLKVETVMQGLDSVLAIKDRLSVSETYHNTFIFYVRFFLNYLFWLTEVVHNACQKHQPKEISACLQLDNVGGSPCLTIGERYAGLIAKAYSEEHGLKFQGLDFKAIQAQRKKGTAVNLINKICRKIALRLCWWSFNRACRKPAVLAASSAYRMDNLMSKLQNEIPGISWILFVDDKASTIRTLAITLITVWCGLSGFESRFFKKKRRAVVNAIFPLFLLQEFRDDTRDEVLKDTLASTWQRIKNLPEMIFKFQGVRLRQYVLDKIYKDILPGIKQLHQPIAGLSKLLEAKGHVFVLSPFSRDIYFALGEVCRKQSVPAMLVSHGTHIPPKNRFEEIEHDHLGRGVINTEFPYVAAQSPWEVKYASHYKLKSKVVKTGPLIWSVVEKAPPANFKQKLLGEKLVDKKVVLHAATQKWRKGLRVYINETPDEYIEEIREIFQAMDKIKNSILLVKFRASDTLSLADLRNSLPHSDRLRIITDFQLTELFSVTDLLVSYQSTVIEEVLINRIPALLYGGRGRYVHFPAFEIKNGQTPEKRPVYHARQINDLAYGIDWLLKNHSGRCLSLDDLNDHFFPRQEKNDLTDFINGFIVEKVSK